MTCLVACLTTKRMTHATVRCLVIDSSSAALAYDETVPSLVFVTASQVHILLQSGLSVNVLVLPAAWIAVGCKCLRLLPDMHPDCG